MNSKKNPVSKTSAGDGITPLPVVVDESIPTLFIDGFQGVAVHGSTVRMNLVEDRIDFISNSMTRHVVTRLIMPYEKFDYFVNILTKVRDDTKLAIDSNTAKTSTTDAG